MTTPYPEGWDPRAGVQAGINRESELDRIFKRHGLGQSGKIRAAHAWDAHGRVLPGRDPIAETRATFDAARAALRSYEDAVLAEAERQGKLAALGKQAQAERTADYAARFPALAERAGQTGGA